MVKSSRFGNPQELEERRRAFQTDGAPPTRFEPASPETLIARQEQMRRFAESGEQPDAGGNPAADPVPPSVQTPVAAAALASVAMEHGLAVEEHVYIVPLDLIDPNPQNSRSGYTAAEIENMRAELKLAGRQLHPLDLEEYVAATGQKRFYCIDGYTRVQAMRLDSWTEAKATFTGPLTPLERYTRSLISNDATRHTTDFDHGIMWTRLISEDGISRQQLSEAVGSRRASPATLSKVLSIAKLPTSVVKLIGENKFFVAHSKYYLLYQMYEAFKKKHGEERAEELIFEKTQLVVADPSYTVDRLEAEAKNAADEGSDSGAGSGGSAGGSGTSSTGGQSTVRPASREIMLTRMGMDVGKIVRPEKGGLKIAIDKRLPAEVVDQIHEAVTKIIEGHAQG